MRLNFGVVRTGSSVPYRLGGNLQGPLSTQQPDAVPKKGIKALGVRDP